MYPVRLFCKSHSWRVAFLIQTKAPDRRNLLVRGFGIFRLRGISQTASHFEGEGWPLKNRQGMKG
jgi:hypothetical protein